MSPQDSYKVGLAAVLVALSFLLALQLPSSGFTGSGSSTLAQSTSAGRLLVSVTLQNETFALPLRGAQVGVTQIALHGLRLTLETNASGEVEFTLPPGTYGVSVGNGKFALSSAVSVVPGNLTAMNVSVKRTANVASFVGAEDSTSQGDIEPWNTVVVEVTPYQFPVLLTLMNPEAQVAVNGTVPASPSPVIFNGTVYLQQISYGAGSGGPVAGPEVPATVISQVVRGGGTWLTLRPGGPLQLTGSSFVQVIGYAAVSSVSIRDA